MHGLGAAARVTRGIVAHTFSCSNFSLLLIINSVSNVRASSSAITAAPPGCSPVRFSHHLHRKPQRKPPSVSVPSHTRDWLTTCKAVEFCSWLRAGKVCGFLVGEPHYCLPVGAKVSRSYCGHTPGLCECPLRAPPQTIVWVFDA